MEFSYSAVVLFLQALFLSLLPCPVKANDCLGTILGGTFGGMIGGLILGSVASVLITVFIFIKVLGHGNRVDIQMNTKRDPSLSFSENYTTMAKESSMPVKYTRKAERYSASQGISGIIDSQSHLIPATEKGLGGQPVPYLNPAPTLLPPAPPTSHVSPPPLSPTIPPSLTPNDEYDIPCIRSSATTAAKLKTAGASSSGLSKNKSKPIPKSMSVDEMKALRLIQDNTMDLEEQYDIFDGPTKATSPTDEYYVQAFVQGSEEPKGGVIERELQAKLIIPKTSLMPTLRPPVRELPASKNLKLATQPLVKLKPVAKGTLSTPASSKVSSGPSTAPKPIKHPPPTAKKPVKEQQLSKTLPYTRSNSMHEYMNIGFKVASKGKQN